MPGYAVLQIQNIHTRWQRHAIVSVPVRSDSRDFSLPVLAEDDQRVLDILFWRDCLPRHCIRRLSRSERNNFQMARHKSSRAALLDALPARIKEVATTIKYLRNGDMSSSTIRLLESLA